jgi:ABC-2 type transport system permease protein
MMKDVLLLLSPRWKKFSNRLKAGRSEKLRFGFISALITLLWGVIFAVFVYALRYFTAEEMFGTIAATKLLSMILITFAFVAVISNMITTFSTFFLSEDLELIMASPVSRPALFTARFLETVAEASWMVLVFGFPVFLAYGRVFSAGWSFYVVSFLGFLCLLVTVTALAILVVQNLVKSFPVRRLRDLFVFVALLIFVGIYLLFRMVRPEDFLNPEGFASMMDYLSVMSESSSPLLPTTWIWETLRPYITGYGFEEIPLFLALLVSSAIMAFRLAGHNHQAVHFLGYSRAFEARGARLSKSRIIGLLTRVLNRFLDQATARLVIKETLLMARDWGRLSQLLLLLALVLVYLYNFTRLPSLETAEITQILKNAIAFLNIGLAGFVLSSLGVRFLFPAISAEGRAFWILKKSPIGLRRILWVKFFFYLVPMLILGLFLVVMTNRVLGMGLFISLVSTVTMAFLTVGLTSLSIGMGVLYADLKQVDANRAFSGFGGLLTMIYGALAVAAVILLEAFPVYRVLTAGYHRHLFTTMDYTVMACCFTLALGVAMTLIVCPLWAGLNQITKMEL